MEELSEDVQQEIIEAVQDILEDYIEHNASIFSKKNYLEIFVEHVSKYISDLAKTEGWYDDCDEDAFEEWIESICIETFEMVSIPLRENSPYNPFDFDKNAIASIIKHINEQPVQKQRTTEWYMIRQTLFSASNIWKLFGTESQYNSLIYEKCKGFDLQKQYENSDILIPNARNWGIKYEPVTVLLYEHKNNTTVNTNYGCIPHTSLPVGASPDGIVCDETSEKYGHLVEIKNIYNRDIDGIPSEEYWIQMQTQLEVCRLELCDFVETRFKEFETEDAYLEDTEHEYSGVICFFIPRNPGEYESYYEYMPLQITKQDRLSWINMICLKKQDTHILYQTSYWYLDEYSCVEVIRNDVWFSCMKPIIEDAWQTVLKERLEGFDHRAPQKKKNARSNSLDNIDNNPNQMVIKVVKLDT